MTKQFSKEKIKRINRITWIASAFIAILFAVLISINNHQEDHLLNDGIREDVIVVQKHKSGSNAKYSSEHYYLTVDWFKVLDTIPYYKSKDTTGLSNAEKMSNDILSKSFKGKARIRTERLNTPIKLKYINGMSYEKLYHGEIVTLVYFKGKPEEGRLLRELE
ncbi:hypothetical protein [Winogradskyella flava]|uniref:Uncharacterized protein n=1 Tax=Winogradskyella flava TaxID=1884876 RepID=A0A842IVP9_9FLAO|nr:hypothetical protein [Winogradskyella flava]MBC2845417.1 hypothetical protein [Winogradskyella flava]